ncbi:MAG: iron-sulfur cluster assembly scaffold protein [Proteobacteria bacterium]|nr:iron-sulfur cluster assembly scaffold protein [Pseudomonadota bacterium]
MEQEEKPFDFWQDHSSHYLEMAFRRDKIERCEAADGYGKRKGVCGDTIEIFLTIRDHKIQYASFDADGCMNTIACANTVVHMIEGQTVDQAWEVTTEKVVDFLETLPSKENHCAELAIGALYMALTDFQKKSHA